MREIEEKYNDKYITLEDIKTIKNNYHKKSFVKRFFINKLIEIKVSLKNKSYIKKELIKERELLDNINGYPLDLNQRIAVITDENKTLVVAGAGSGKTLTIIGKIRYLVEVKKIKQEDILCISFTNESVNSIKQALTKKYNYNISVRTFHKLSLEILKNKQNVSIAPADYLEYLIDEYFNSDIFYEEDNLYYLKEYLKITYRDENIEEEYLDQLKRIIITFINIFKANDYELEDFKYLFFKIEKLHPKHKKSNKLLLLIIINIYLKYDNELKSANSIDFSDMINIASKHIKNNKIKLNYKYIIIDEYQDTSLTRFNLINNIIENNKAKLFVVGDDFQSIYGFTGCNLDIFLNFKKYVGGAKTLKITKTYRTPKELIEVAGKFVMRNKRQIRKVLIANKKIKKPIVICYYKDIIKSVISIIDKINCGNILILGRNNKDINMIVDNLNFINENGMLKYSKNSNINLKYLTVHRSKGLEEDNVIMLNMINGITGFPNKIQNAELISMITKKDNFLYEEERRLFYVAITRTKNKVYLMVPTTNESVFIKELKKYYKNNMSIKNLQ